MPMLTLSQTQHRVRRQSGAATALWMALRLGAFARRNLTQRREGVESVPSTVVYAIRLINFSDVANEVGMGAQALLEELASLSGGKAFFPRSEAKLQAVLDRLSLELRYHYTIGFNPQSSTPDKQWHKIKVKLTLPPKDENGKKYPHLNLRYREGYFNR